jgi:hypothetical protein
MDHSLGCLAIGQRRFKFDPRGRFTDVVLFPVERPEIDHQRRRTQQDQSDAGCGVAVVGL